MQEDKVVKNKINIDNYDESLGKVAFSDGSFMHGSFIITDDQVLGNISLNFNTTEFLSNIKNFSFLNNYIGNKEILIVGCGNNFIIPNNTVKQYIEQLGFGLEWTTTISAYMVFNAVVQDYRTCIALFLSDFKIL